MITVYSLAYNEEVLLQFMIDHYKERFPGCQIVIYDNISTDYTVKIAQANGCDVISFDTMGQFQDRRHIEIKDNCWKDAKTDWVLVCDLDEMLDINAKELKEEEKVGSSIIRSRGYEMINRENNLDIAGIKYGSRDPNYDKVYLFNKKLVNATNYSIGCHNCNPEGTIKYSSKVYKLYHYSSICEGVTFKKRETYRKRMSPENIKNGWSSHYFFALTPEQIHKQHLEERAKARRVR